MDRRAFKVAGAVRQHFFRCGDQSHGNALQFYELARKEIGALIVADEHPNIVRCFAMEEDVEFVYLALERCKQSLNDLLGSGNSSGRELFLSGHGNVTEFCMKVSKSSCLSAILRQAL